MVIVDVLCRAKSLSDSSWVLEEAMFGATFGAIIAANLAADLNWDAGFAPIAKSTDDASNPFSRCPSLGTRKSFWGGSSGNHGMVEILPPECAASEEF